MQTTSLETLEEQQAKEVIEDALKDGYTSLEAIDTISACFPSIPWNKRIEILFTTINQLKPKNYAKRGKDKHKAIQTPS